MIRKAVSVILALILLMSLAACGTGSAQPQSTPIPEDDVVASPLPTPTPIPDKGTPPVETPEPTPEPTPESTTQPENMPAVEVTPQPTPEATASPTPELTPEPTPDSQPAATDCYGIWNSILLQIGAENLPAFMSGTGDDLLNLYGIDPALVEDFQLQVPMMAVHATEIFIAKVAPENMESVKNGIALRKQNLLDQWSTYLPDQYELVDKAQVVQSGDYIIFVIAHEADAMVSVFNSMTAK